MSRAVKRCFLKLPDFFQGAQPVRFSPRNLLITDDENGVSNFI